MTVYTAYHSHSSCVKLEDLRQLLGGLYSWHPCTQIETATYIYEQFLKLSKKVYNKEGKYKKYENYHVVEFEDEKMKYRIHVFSTARLENKRKHMCINAGVLLKFDFEEFFRCPHWRIWGGVPGTRHPLWDPILSFSHTFSPKSACVGCPHPPNEYTPPPTGNPGSATGPASKNNFF